jgi:hypothetical protein
MLHIKPVPGVAIPSLKAGSRHVYAIRGPNCAMEVAMLDNLVHLQPTSVPILPYILRGTLGYVRYMHAYMLHSSHVVNDIVLLILV